MSSVSTLSEKIVLAVGTGRDPAEIDTLEAITASSTEINALTGATAANDTTGKVAILGTSGALTVASTLTTAGVLTPPIGVADATPYSVLAANTGKTHLIADQTSSITLNLPATATAGLKYTFKSKAVAAEAQNWVIVATTAAFYKGGVAWLDNDAGPAAAEVKSVFPNGSSHLTLTVVTPSGGTFVTVEADGTNWFVSGMVNSATTPAFT